MKVIVCTRDLDYGVGSVVKTDITRYELDKGIKKVLLIGPKRLEGFSKKIEFRVIPNLGGFFITKEPNFAIKCNKAIKEILSDESYDRIFLHFPIRAEDYGVPVTAKFHGLHKSIIKNYPMSFKFFIASIFHRLYSHFDYLTMKHAEEVLFVSRKTMDEAKDFYPEFKNKFRHSPNQVDKKNFFKLSGEKRRKLRKQFGFDDGKFNILYVGRLEPLKGILELVQVLEEINNPKFRLVVIGDGPLKGEVIKHSFVKYIGKIPNDEMCNYYNAADLFVLPSFYENSPVTVAEAQACGCNVLVRSVGDLIYSVDRVNRFNSEKELKEKLMGD